MVQGHGGADSLSSGEISCAHVTGAGLNWVSLLTMEGYLELINAVLCLVLLTWGLLDWVKQRRNTENLDNGLTYQNPHFLVKIAPFYSLTITVLYPGFGVYEFRYSQTLSNKSILLSLTWALATSVAAYSRKKWPLVLVLWWVYST